MSHAGFPRGTQLLELVRNGSGVLPPLDVLAPWWSVDPEFHVSGANKMTDPVAVKTIDAQPIAAVRRHIRRSEIAAEWKPALDLVWAFLQRHPWLRTQGHNVFVYHQTTPGSEYMDVEFGVQVVHEFDSEGDVVASFTPSGEVASAVADGYAAISSAHSTIQEWCAHEGRESAGVSIEVYGDPDESDAEKVDIEVMYLLRSGRPKTAVR